MTPDLIRAHWHRTHQLDWLVRAFLLADVPDAIWCLAAPLAGAMYDAIDRGGAGYPPAILQTIARGLPREPRWTRRAARYLDQAQQSFAQRMTERVVAVVQERAEEAASVATLLIRGHGESIGTHGLARGMWPTWGELAHELPDRESVEQLSILRQADVEPDVCLAALSRLAQSALSFGRHAAAHWCFTSLAPAVLTRLYAWPLLVGRVSANGGAIAGSLPLRLLLSEAPPQDSGTRESTRILAPAHLDISQWEAVLNKAQQAAEDVWTSRSSETARDTRGIRGRFVARLDLREAAAILKPIGDAGIAVNVLGRSCEAYFACWLFSAYHGQRRPSATAVSATIEKPRRAPGGGVCDYALGPVAELADKAAYVGGMLGIERIVVPANQVKDVARIAGLRVEGAVSLQHVVTLALGHVGARRYLRAPELVKYDLSTTSSGIGVAEALGQGVHTVARCFADSLEVRGALEGLRRQCRPAGISWVILDVDGLEDGDVWELLWDACGGDMGQLRRLLAAATRGGAVRSIVALLDAQDRALGTMERLAPDLLILLRTGPVSNRVDSRPIQPEHLLEQAAYSLDAVRTGAVERALGRTRVLLVTKPETPIPGDTTELQDGAGIIDQGLRVFRSGIDHATVERFCTSLSCSDTSQTVKRFHRAGLLRAVGGLHFVPRELRTDRPELHPEQLARVHLAAALALVPVLNRTPGCPDDLDRSLEPERLIESSHHLSQVRHILGSIRPFEGIRGLWKRSRAASVVLSIGLRPPRWDKLAQALELSPVAAAELVEKLEATGDRLGNQHCSRQLLAGTTFWLAQRDKQEPRATSWRERAHHLLATGAELWASSHMRDTRSLALPLGFLPTDAPEFLQLSHLLLSTMQIPPQNEEERAAAGVSTIWMVRFSALLSDNGSLEVFEKAAPWAGDKSDLVMQWLGAALMGSAADVSSASSGLTKVSLALAQLPLRQLADLDSMYNRLARTYRAPMVRDVVFRRFFRAVLWFGARRNRSEGGNGRGTRLPGAT